MMALPAMMAAVCRDATGVKDCPYSFHSKKRLAFGSAGHPSGVRYVCLNAWLFFLSISV